MRTKALYLIPVAAVALSAFATPELINSVSPEADREVANAGKVTTIPANTEIVEAKNVEEASNPAAMTNGDEAMQYTGTVEYPEGAVHYEGTVIYPEEAAPEAPSPTTVESAEPDDEIWEVVEENPLYKGDKSNAALMELMMRNMKYPQTASEKGVQGRVLVQFVVEKDGTLSNYKVLPKKEYTSPSVVEVNAPNAGKPGYITQEEYDTAVKALEAEAVRVVKLTSGNWTPGKQRGKAVRVRYTFPVTYRLN